MVRLDGLASEQGQYFDEIVQPKHESLVVVVGRGGAGRVRRQRGSGRSVDMAMSRVCEIDYANVNQLATITGGIAPIVIHRTGCAIFACFAGIAFVY